MISQLRGDFEYAWRSLRRSPVFTIVVAVTLSLGIGANAAVLGVIDTMLYRKLPVPQPDRVVGVYTVDRRLQPGAPLHYGGLTSQGDYLNIRSRIQGVTGLASFSMETVVSGGPLAEADLYTAFVSGNYFDVFDVRAQIGRTIRADEEDPPGAHPVVVISDFLWRSAYGADPSVLGREIEIGKGKFTIVGIAPKAFTGAQSEGRTNLWIPYTMRSIARGSDGPSRMAPAVQIIGRLAPGATVEQASTSAVRVAQELRATYPAADSLLYLRLETRDRLVRARDMGGNVLFLWAAWGMIALLHLVACSNVASLMLARANARRRELGVRLCLGASRSRILIGSLAEAALLALFGACGGLVVGRWLSGLIATMHFLSTSDSGLDLRVVGIVAVVTAGTVLQFGLLPALDASRTDPLALLRGATAARKRAGLDRAGMVIVAQVAMSLILLGNAAAFLEMFARQSTSEPGYDVSHLVVATVSARDPRATPIDLAAAYDEAIARARGIPGAVSVAAAEGAPLLLTGWVGEIVIPGRPPSADVTQTSLQAIGPAYFQTIGAVMAAGREFTTADRATPGESRAFDVVVINEAFARRYWPGESALGKQLALRGQSPATVVGIVRDLHDVSTMGVAPRAYFPLLEKRFASFNLIVRGPIPEALLPALSSALQGSASFGRVTVRSIASVRSDVIAPALAGGIGMAICGAVALLLTAVGLYGVVSMWVARRRLEIGIRLALGSPTRDVHRLILRDAVQLVGVGSAIGLVCAFGLIQVERGRLGSMLALDAIPVASSLLLFLAIAGTAALIPSWRASKQPPGDVLRSS